MESVSHLPFYISAPYTIRIQECDTIMAKNRVIHARLDDETHDQLTEKCNELGCSVTDFISESIRTCLEEKSDPKPTVTELQKPKLVLLD